MQISFSWQAIIATVIFFIAVCLLGFTLVRNVRSRTPAQAPTSGVTSEVAVNGAAGAGTPSTSVAVATAASPTLRATATATAPSPTPPAPTDTATAPALPTDTPAPTATVEPTATLEPTVALTPTPFVLPTREPTPAPERLIVERVGFGQFQEQMSYAFVVSNPNPGLLVRNTLFQVAIYDTRGTVLRAEGGIIALIGPAQRIGIGEVVPLPIGSEVERVEIQLREGAFAATAEQVPALPIENQAFIGGEIQRITGIVKNPFGFDLENLTFVGIAYQNGEIVGGGNAALPFIPAQGQAAIDIPVATSAAPDLVEIYPLLEIVGGS